MVAMKITDKMVYAPNTSYARRYNKVVIQIYLSPMREGKVSIKHKGNRKTDTGVGYARGRY